MQQLSIERVTLDPRNLLAELVELATAEGHDLGATTLDQWVSGENRFARPGEGFFVGRVDGVVVAMCGLNIDPYLDDLRVGRLRHLYVHPDHRRSGTARVMVEHCLALAETSFDRVRLRTANPAADVLYQSIGFDVVDHPTATHQRTRSAEGHFSPSAGCRSCP